MSQWFRRWRDIVRENRRYLLVAVLLFAGGVALGLMVMQVAPQAASQALRKLITPLSRMAKDLSGMSKLSQAAYIFGNNLRVAVLLVVGSFVLGFFPFIVLVSNGLLVGLFAASLPAAGTLTATQFVIGLIPHGVFEIPAILFSAMIGLRIGREVWRGLLTVSWQGLRESVQQAVALLPAVAILLVIAASMEAYVSPLVMGLHFLQ